METCTKENVFLWRLSATRTCNTTRFNSSECNDTLLLRRLYENADLSYLIDALASNVMSPFRKHCSCALCVDVSGRRKTNIQALKRTGGVGGFTGNVEWVGESVARFHLTQVQVCMCAGVVPIYSRVPVVEQLLGDPEPVQPAHHSPSIRLNSHLLGRPRLKLPPVPSTEQFNITGGKIDKDLLLLEIRH